MTTDSRRSTDREKSTTDSERITERKRLLAVEDAQICRKRLLAVEATLTEGEKATIDSRSYTDRWRESDY